MRSLVLLLSLCLACGTSTQTKDPIETSQRDSVPETDLSEFFAEASTDTLRKQPVDLKPAPQKTNVAPDPTPCSSQMLLYVDNHLDSLTVSDILMFLATFHQDCNTNAEFTAWSNALLFKVIMTDVDLYMEAWHTRGLKDLAFFMEEIKYPIIEVNYQSLYDSIRLSNAPKDLIYAHLEAVVFAAEQEHQPIVTD